MFTSTTKCLPLSLLFLAVSCSLLADAGDDAYFNYQISSALPSPQYFAIISQTPGQQASNITVHTSGQSWVQASLSSTTTPTTLTISVNPVGLPAGSYFATVEVTNPTSALQYHVSLTVTAPPPPLAVSPSNLTFNAVQGSAPPASQTLQVGASIPGTAIFSSSTSNLPNWLNMSWFGVGTAPVTIQVSINPSFSNLVPGTYSTSMRFYTIFPDRDITVPITLVVTVPPPVLKITTNQLQFNFLLGSTTPVPQSIQIIAAELPCPLPSHCRFPGSRQVF
jgi:hypothetical protein